MTDAPLSTNAGLRDLAQKCFRVANVVTDEDVRRELIAYGNELMEQISQSAPDARKDSQDRDGASTAIVLSLGDLRRLLGKTQREIAASLSVQRNAVSKFEKRQNVCVSSLRGYLSAMGAKLHLIASFPDQSQIFIENLGPEADRSCRKLTNPSRLLLPPPSLAKEYSSFDD